MTLQLINNKPFTFRANNTEYTFCKPNLLIKNFFTVVEPKVKGSTLGWNIEGEFLSYNQLKKIL